MEARVRSRDLFFFQVLSNVEPQNGQEDISEQLCRFRSVRTETIGRLVEKITAVSEEKMRGGLMARAPNSLRLQRGATVAWRTPAPQGRQLNTIILRTMGAKYTTKKPIEQTDSSRYE